MEGSPSLLDLRAACVALFDARHGDALVLGREGREWPPEVIAHPHWVVDFSLAAGSAGLEIDLAKAVIQVADWVAQIETAADPAGRSVDEG